MSLTSEDCDHHLICSLIISFKDKKLTLYTLFFDIVVLNRVFILKMTNISKNCIVWLNLNSSLLSTPPYERAFVVEVLSEIFF